MQSEKDTSDKTGSAAKAGAAKSGTARQKKPEWANGLRQLYDSVVDEPLPDAFKDLLSKLDDKA